MTIIVGILVNPKTAVIAADSLLSDVSGNIHSAIAQKIGRFGSLTLAYCGDGTALETIRAAKVRSWAELNEWKAPKGLDFGFIAYDHLTGILWEGGTSRGVPTKIARTYANGSGHAFATGILDLSSRPRTVGEASNLARMACKAAIKRNVNCGGRIRVRVVERT